MSSSDENLLFGYKKLIAWQKSHELALQIYKITLNFPREETFGITSQLRRAALSVPTNIVEGHARHNKKEFCRFLMIAMGSLTEVEYLLEFALTQGYISEGDFQQISQLRLETGHILWKLYNSQK